jgi:hypothetical protein
MKTITRILDQRAALSAFALAALTTAGVGVSPSALHAAEGLVMSPKRLGGYVDVGQAFRDEPKDKQALSRTGTYLTISGVHNERLEVTATLGGLFWYAFPELSNTSRILRFGPGVGQAQAVYSFGDDPLNNPTSQLQFGLFPVKYNKDAANLGEYLFRSGTYPGYVATGGWSYLNSASFLMQGVRWTLPTLDGKVTHEFTVHMERDYAQPLHDFSPGYMVTAKPIPAVEIGGGVVWSNALTFSSKRLAPKDPNNAYSKSTGLPVMGLTDFQISACSTPGAEQNCYQDTAYGMPDTLAARATLNAWNTCQSTGDCSDIDYYTFRGFKTMARASVDVGMLLGSSLIKNGDFKVYSEIALLGVEDQPFYYEDKLERLPIMMGINIPTFGLLDRLALETEYRKSRFPNSFAYPFDNRGAIPLPLAGENSDTPYDYTDAAVAADPGKFEADDWKWSVYATKTLTQGMGITAQIASDHLRPFSNVGTPPSVPYTTSAKDWYYVLRINFGI